VATTFFACWGMQSAGTPIAPSAMVAYAAAAAVGSLAPDLDHPSSLASLSIPCALLVPSVTLLGVAWYQGQMTGPHMLPSSFFGPSMLAGAWAAIWVAVGLLVSALVARSLFGHRGLVHSIGFGAIAATGVAVVLLLNRAPVSWALAFAWGWATHLAADSGSRVGLPDLFWPLGSFRSVGAAKTPSVVPMPPMNPSPAASAELAEALKPPWEPVEAESVSARSLTPAPCCPRCHIPMVLRTARRGGRTGTMFYGCANFPRCRQTSPYEPVESTQPEQARQPDAP
jgi:hypothetical protein